MYFLIESFGWRCHAFYGAFQTPRFERSFSRNSGGFCIDRFVTASV
jgi:hypothetical protein